MALAQEMRSLSKELEEIAVAISLVGTTHTKLRELVSWAEEIRDAIRGERPEVKKLRDEIARRIHDVKVSPPDPRVAKKLRALRHAIETAKNQVQKGLGEVPETFSLNVVGNFAEFTIGNSWGYTLAEAEPSLRALRRTLARMSEIGLNPGKDLSIVLDPQWSEGWSAKYDREWETIAMDPYGRGSEGGGSAGPFAQTAHAFGHRVWDQVMKAEDREAWASAGAFALALSTFLVGEKVSADDAARLAVTVGKRASDWPAKVAIR